MAENSEKKYKRIQGIYKLKRSGPLTSGSRYGTALLNLGKLDGDKCEDFAVGAPYDGEDHSGAIYIYRGSKDFWDNHHRNGRV